MDSFEFTKIAGAVLAALLLIFGTKTAIEMNIGAHHADVAGYTLPEPAPEAAPADNAQSGDAAPAGPSFAELFAKASVDGGKSVFSKCKACHNVDKGGANGIGPNLWGVTGRKRGAHEGYGYSEAMKAKGGEWALTELDAFLTSPKANVPGTKMIFNGLSAPADRANLIAYLNSQSDAPLPAPAAPAAPAAAAPAATDPAATAAPAGAATPAPPAK